MRIRKPVKSLLILLVALYTISALGLTIATAQEPETQPTENQHMMHQGDRGHHAQPADEAEHDSSDAVTVAEDGTRFDPPVAAERIPAGAWYCPMEPVHYASMTAGDGSCPVCGMFLSQREADAEPPSDDSHTEHGH